MGDKADIVNEVRRELGLHINRELAEFLGISLRTVQRYIYDGGVSSPRDCEKLIAAVYPKNETLASRLAATIGTDLVKLGLKPPTPPPAPVAQAPRQSLLAPEPPRLPPATDAHADAVVCAVADLLEQPPAAVRHIVAAAFGRALELGVDQEGLARLLAAGRPAPPGKS